MFDAKLIVIAVLGLSAFGLAAILIARDVRNRRMSVNVEKLMKGRESG